MSGSRTGADSRFHLYKMLLLSRFSRVQTLCDPRDCSLPGSSVHGIFQARVLEWGAIAFSHLQDEPGALCSVRNKEIHHTHTKMTGICQLKEHLIAKVKIM